MDYTSHYDSPIGGITMASDGHALVGLWFDKQKYFADTLQTKNEKTARIISSDTSDSSDSSEFSCPPDASLVFDLTKRWLDEYFSGKVPDFTPPLVMRASGFRRRVWELLLQIPYGHTMSYGEIAAVIARERQLKSMSAQAVGGAVGHNSIGIIIPCHRVIGAHGELTGYAGGLDKKKQLLKIEGIL